MEFNVFIVVGVKREGERKWHGVTPNMSNSKMKLSEFLSSISLYNDTWSKIFAKKNRYLGSFISALTETLKETGGECDRHIVKMSITTYRACFQYRPILSLALPIILFLIT